MLYPEGFIFLRKFMSLLKLMRGCHEIAVGVLILAGLNLRDFETSLCTVFANYRWCMYWSSRSVRLLVGVVEARCHLRNEDLSTHALRLRPIIGKIIMWAWSTAATDCAKSIYDRLGWAEWFETFVLRSARRKTIGSRFVVKLLCGKLTHYYSNLTPFNAAIWDLW